MVLRRPGCARQCLDSTTEDPVFNWQPPCHTNAQLICRPPPSNIKPISYSNRWNLHPKNYAWKFPFGNKFSVHHMGPKWMCCTHSKWHNRADAHTQTERESVSRIIDLDRDLLILIVHWLAICSYHRRHSHSTKCKTIGMSCFNKQFKLSARLSTTPEINWITHTHTHTRLCGESYVQQTICFHWICDNCCLSIDFNQKSALDAIRSDGSSFVALSLSLSCLHIDFPQ